MRILILMLVNFTLSYAQPIFVNWSEVSSGVTTSLNSVSDYGSLAQPAVWACGNNGTVIKSTNNGNNWVNVGINGIPNTVILVNVFGIDRDIAFAAGYIGSNTYVYRTSNGGTNWTQVFTQTNGFINAVWIVRFTQNGFMQGNPVNGRWSLWKTTNRGITWDSTGLFLPQAGSESGFRNSLWVEDINRIWFGTNSSKIYFSTNIGINWSSQSTNPEINVSCIWFNLNGTTGFAAGSNLLSTTNLGNNWVSLSSLGTGSFTGVAGIPFNYTYLWYTRENNLIYRSTNNGINWTLNYTAPSGGYKHLSYSRSNGSPVNYVWGVRDSGGISRGQILIPDGFTLISSKIPNSFLLYSNYPNPFNPATRIRFDISSGILYKNKIQLKIFDITGKGVSVLLDENLRPGTYEVTFDGSHLASGIYFYTINAGTFRDTKKMILIK